MDNRGYIFSTDAVLALVIFFVIAGSILTYYTLPSYLGADHQHLEAEADSALALLTSDGDLHAAILKINSNDTQKQEEGKQLLNDKLRLILPSDVAYDLKVGDVSISDNKGINNPNDRVSRYTVISAPEEGWMGRAWYKIEDVNFKEERINTTQTLWNFHNYLANFGGWGGQLGSNTFWGKEENNNAPVPIMFSIPSDAALKNVYYIMGCQGKSGDRSLRVTTKYRSTKQDLKEGWQGTSKWYPTNGTWNDINVIWAYSDFYLLPDVLSDLKVDYPESENTQSSRYTKVLPKGMYPDLDAFPSFAFKLHVNNDIIFSNISGYPNSKFKYLFRRDKGGQEVPSGVPVFNAIGDIPIDSLHNGLNSFYVEFIGALNNNHNMPWFSILGDYQTSILIPEGINTDRFPKESESKKYYCAGAGMQASSFSYNLTSGAKSTSGVRRILFDDYRGHDSIQNGVNYANGTPFWLDKPYVDGNNKDGSAVAQEYLIDLTPEGNEKINSKNINIVDAYAVINTYGATDKVLVEVYNGTNWNEVFYSQTNSKVTSGGSGYGNTPGTVYIPPEYLAPNVVNKLRVTVWDDAGKNNALSSRDGYDFVGLVDTYAVVSFTSLPIKWDNYPFVSEQSKCKDKNPNNTLSQIQTFEIGSIPNAEKIMFFFGVGLDTSHVKLEVSNNKDMKNPKTLYDNDTIPFALDIGAIDVADNPIFTTATGEGNYTGKPGKYYARLTVDVENAWKSGDEQSDSGGAREYKDSAACEIFSGSRVSVIYPKFLDNEWTTEYADTADDAKKKATKSLIAVMNSSGYSVDSNLIQSEALYTGDMPNNVPIRLDLWRS